MKWILSALATQEAVTDPMRFSKSDVYQAHAKSNNNKPELEWNELCGCFSCVKIFRSSEINDWIIHDNPSDWRGTALCPYCGIDSVIGESSGYPITEEFLAAMNRYWF